MPALTTPSRALLLSLGLGAFAAAYALSENAAARDAAYAGNEVVAAPLRRAAPRVDETLRIGRDPFVADVAAVAAVTSAAPAAVAAAPPPDPVRGGVAVPVLPPNAGAGAAPPSSPADSSLRITAVATGAQPYAVAESGGTTRIVTVGETLADGRRVERIDAAGVLLRGGALLTTRGSP